MFQGKKAYTGVALFVAGALLRIADGRWNLGVADLADLLIVSGGGMFGVGVRAAVGRRARGVGDGL